MAGGKRWQQLDAFNHSYTIGEVASAFGGADYFNGWSMFDAVSLRAPDGALDANMQLLLAIVNSLRQTPQYARQLAELRIKLSNISHQKAMDTIDTYRKISEMSYRTSQQINQSIMESYDDRNRSGDASQRRFVHYIRDLDDYVDPGTNARIALPSTYDNVYRNASGEYLLTNEVAPPSGGWQKVLPAK